jgi:hypothetical protein
MYKADYFDLVVIMFYVNAFIPNYMPKSCSSFVVPDDNVKISHNHFTIKSQT